MLTNEQGSVTVVPVLYGRVEEWLRSHRDPSLTSLTSMDSASSLLTDASAQIMSPSTSSSSSSSSLTRMTSSPTSSASPPPSRDGAPPELLLKDNPQRFCLYPIQYPDLFDFYKKHMHTFWTAEEIDFSLDKNDWKHKLNADERYFIEHILAFFAGSDGIVLENLVSNFCQEVQLAEARCFYAFQAMMENVHSEVYSLMIDTLVEDEARKALLFDAIQSIPCVRQKAEWSMKWISPDNTFATRLVAFVIVEGLFFSGSFCSIFWLKERGLMTHSLGKSNEWIARDEGLHQNFGAHLYTRYIQHKIPLEIVHCMIREAVRIESEFLTISLPVRLIGMNQDMMIQYIQYVADRILVQLEYPKLYKVSNPFQFMEKIGLDGKTNFFEQRVSEYALAKRATLSDQDFTDFDKEDF